MYMIIYPQPETRERVLAAARAGLTGPDRPLDLPGLTAVDRWRRQDPAFAQALAAARRAAADGRFHGRRIFQAFSYDRRDAFLAQMRAGVPIKDLTKPWLDKRQTLRAWRLQDGHFNQAFLAAKARARKQQKNRLIPFDPDLADAIIVAVSRGQMLKSMVKDRGWPGPKALRRWRRENPDFASGLAIALRHGNSARRRARRYRPEVLARLCDHIEGGGSMRTAGLLEGMPNAMTLSRWRSRPAFFEEVRWAEKMRTESLTDQAIEAGDRMDMTGMKAIGKRLGQLSGGRREREDPPMAAAPYPPTMVRTTPQKVRLQSVIVMRRCENPTTLGSPLLSAKNFHMAVAVTFPTRRTTPMMWMNFAAS